MNMLWFIYFSCKKCLFLIGIFLGDFVNSEQPLIEIPQGILRGISLRNRDGGTFYAFRSLPYGQPPVGQLRFKAPLPAAGWHGIRDASIDIPTCTQFIMGSQNSFFGQEDCLYLNVFTTELPSSNTTKKSVMVFIHGGGYMSGAVTSKEYGPEFLMTKDIVLVTFAYRLGIFGFFNLNEPQLGVPGNAALKDQVLALKWVKDNIEYFNGDPNKVLIFGDSAGGISVHMHILSPVSTDVLGLFTKAIAQSGSAIIPGFTGTKNNGLMIAEVLGIETTNFTKTLDTLQSLSTDQIARAGQHITESSHENLYFASAIVEEPPEEAFLTQKPIDILLSGNFTPVPLLLGFNDIEGTYEEVFSMHLTGHSKIIESSSEVIPPDLEIATGSEKGKIISEKLRKFYFDDYITKRNNIPPAINLYSDLMFCFPTYRTALEIVKVSSYPVYFYYFKADTRLNYMKHLQPYLLRYRGAAHGDERGYLFQTHLTPTDIEEDGNEDLAIRQMVDMWVNFAISGNPTPNNDYGFQWEPMTEEVFNFLHIGTNFSYQDINPRARNMAFWLDIYKEYFPRR